MHAIQARFGPYRYRFTQSLVRTEMSELWIAEEQRAKEKIPKTVAVKIALLHSENRRTYSRADQLAIENEERWLTGFRNQHPNIVKLRQIAEEGSSERRVYRARSRMDGEPWFIVTDYLPGGDLNNLLKERRHLPASLALEIAEHVSSALDFIHTKNCVHCDIKTRNILFKAAPTGYRLTPETEPILIDFGIAKSASVEEQRVTGTPRWMPPEVREKMDRAEKQKPEATWDTYGLGLVLYSMLAGRVAHAGKESQQAWVRFEPEHFAADPSVADPAAMASGLNRLLERTTNDRPEERLSARELGVELQQLQRLTQTPVEIKPKASSTRKRWPVLVMMALLVASMVGAWFLLAPAGEAPIGPTPLVPTTVADGSGADGFGAPIKKPPGPSGGDEASGAIIAAVDTATATATPSNTATSASEPTLAATPTSTRRATATATISKPIAPPVTTIKPTSTAFTTPTKQPTSTPAPTKRPTSTPRATRTPTPLPTPSSTQKPSNTPIAKAPTVSKGDKSVALLSPYPIDTLHGEVRFAWEPQFEVGGNDCFEVRIWDGGPDNWRNGFGLRRHSQETTIFVGVDAALVDQLADLTGRTVLENGHSYSWGVILTSCEPYAPIGLISEAREFRYGGE